MRPLILASTSPFRRALLDRLGVAYLAVAPEFEEIAPEGAAPIDCARLFAEGKALSLARRFPGALIIGADQALDLGGELLRKPTTLDEAASTLARLAGQTHALHTAIAVHAAGDGDAVESGGADSQGRQLGSPNLLSDVVTVALRMRPLGATEIERYLALDRPVGSAGAYLFEKHGVWLFDDVRPADETAIVGLPLVPLCRLLRRLGVDLLAP